MFHPIADTSKQAIIKHVATNVSPTVDAVIQVIDQAATNQSQKTNQDQNSPQLGMAPAEVWQQQNGPSRPGLGS